MAAAVSKSFVACCIAREGSDLFRMGEPVAESANLYGLLISCIIIGFKVYSLK